MTKKTRCHSMSLAWYNLNTLEECKKCHMEIMPRQRQWIKKSKECIRSLRFCDEIPADCIIGIEKEIICSNCGHYENEFIEL